MAKLEVFVSHLKIEAKFADLLSSRLRRDFIGLINLFISSDATSIPVGSRWFEHLIAALEKAHLQLVICSVESPRRPWINYEAGAARVRKIDVIPLCHSGMTAELLPVPLSMSEGVVLTESEGLKKLYAKLSELLDSDLPEVDFEQYSREFQQLEEEYRQQRKDDAIATETPTREQMVENPRVLCVTSKQYMQLGFENQLQVVLDAFPEKLHHNRVLTSDDLQAALSGKAGEMGKAWEIVHIAAYVCPRSGSLYFSPVKLPSGDAEEGDRDLIRAEALAMLLRDAKTRLVVISSGDSLALATTLLRVTNVIAPRDIVSAMAMALWVKTFYGALAVKSLAEACELAGKTSQAPMRLLSQQTTLPEIKFRATHDT